MVHGTRSRRRRSWNYFNRSVNLQHATSLSPPPPPSVIIKRYVTCSVQTENEMSQTKKKSFDIYDLESLNRISNLPIVESGINYAEHIYRRIKMSNNLVSWTLDQAENSIQTAIDVATPAIVLFQGPISSVDKLVCKSLDIVEQTVPSINLPPEMIYWNTKQYVTDMGTKIARPVLKRADSVKEIGNAVLASKYTVFAAESLDGALNVADKYVDKYLPASDEQSVDEVDTPIDGPTGKTIHTMQHANRFSKKLKRRLTQRTIAEVKALKQQSAEAVNVLIYVAELVATDPLLAYQKGKELWASLSKDEPENQARPENLEQLIVLLTRESARRAVHLINFSSGVISKVPRRVSHSLTTVLRKLLNATDSMVKTVHLEKTQQTIVNVLKHQVRVCVTALAAVNVYFGHYLEYLAENVAPQEAPKSALSVPQIKVQTLRATIRNSKQNSNGFENNS